MWLVVEYGSRLVEYNVEHFAIKHLTFNLIHNYPLVVIRATKKGLLCG